MAFFEYDAKTGRVFKTHEHPDYGKDGKRHYVIPDVEEYHSPVTGQLISGRKQRERDLRATKSRPWEGMEQERKEAEKRKRQEQERHESEVHRQVERAFMQLPDDKRRQLAGGSL